MLLQRTEDCALEELQEFVKKNYTDLKTTTTTSASCNIESTIKVEENIEKDDGRIVVIQASKYPANTREQYDEWKKYWPVSIVRNLQLIPIE